MLEDAEFKVDGRIVGFYTDVRSTEDIPASLEFWPACVARDLLRLGAYFRALSLMIQVPGAAKYKPLMYDDLDDNAPNADEYPCDRLNPADRHTVFSVLAECLKRLGVERLVKQIPGARRYDRIDLTEQWTEYLDRHANFKNGLLNVIAACLDELLVNATSRQIDSEPRPTWWQYWWAKM